MSLILTRPLVFFDLETTWTKVEQDRIIEISILKLFSDNKKEIYTYRTNPTIPIPQEATAVHHIKDEDIVNEKTFEQLAPTIIEILRYSDFVGYNIHNFDLSLLRYEFLRANINFPIDYISVIDPNVIFFKKEPRDLSAAYKFFCNDNLEDAHSAEADIIATKKIFLAQIEHYGDIGNDVKQLAKYSIPKFKRADISGKFIYNDGNEVLFNFGKNKGKKLIDQSDYARWMLNSNFSEDIKK